MAKRDKFHDAVKVALQKDGWKITHDPLYLEWALATIQIDLGAEPLIAAVKEEEKIAVEIKSFASHSVLSEFHTALGQYLNHLSVLEEVEPERKLFLAVTLDVFTTFLAQPLGRKQVKRYNLKLLVYDPQQEAIVRWQK